MENISNKSKSELKAEIKQSKAENKLLKSELALLRAKNRSLEKQIADNKATIDTLLEKVEYYFNELSKAVHVNHKLHQKINKLRKRHNALWFQKHAKELDDLIDQVESDDAKDDYEADVMPDFDSDADDSCDDQGHERYDLPLASAEEELDHCKPAVDRLFSSQEDKDVQEDKDEAGQLSVKSDDDHQD